VVFGLHKKLRQEQRQLLKRIPFGKLSEIFDHKIKICLIAFDELTVKVDDIVDDFLEIFVLLILQHLDQD